MIRLLGIDKVGPDSYVIVVDKHGTELRFDYKTETSDYEVEKGKLRPVTYFPSSPEMEDAFRGYALDSPEGAMGGRVIPIVDEIIRILFKIHHEGMEPEFPIVLHRDETHNRQDLGMVKLLRVDKRDPDTYVAVVDKHGTELRFDVKVSRDPILCGHPVQWFEMERAFLEYEQQTPPGRHACVFVIPLINKALRIVMKIDLGEEYELPALLHPDNEVMTSDEVKDKVVKLLSVDRIDRDIYAIVIDKDGTELQFDIEISRDPIISTDVSPEMLEAFKEYVYEPAKRPYPYRTDDNPVVDEIRRIIQSIDRGAEYEYPIVLHPETDD